MHDAGLPNDFWSSLLTCTDACARSLCVRLSLFECVELIVKKVVHGLSLFLRDAGGNYVVATVRKTGALRMLVGHYLKLICGMKDRTSVSTACKLNWAISALSILVTVPTILYVTCKARCMLNPMNFFLLMLFEAVYLAQLAAESYGLFFDPEGYDCAVGPLQQLMLGFADYLGVIPYYALVFRMCSLNIRLYEAAANKSTPIRLEYSCVSRLANAIASF